jgi:hypothetical protein
MTPIMIRVQRKKLNNDLLKKTKEIFVNMNNMAKNISIFSHFLNIIIL